MGKKCRGMIVTFLSQGSEADREIKFTTTLYNFAIFSIKIPLLLPINLSSSVFSWTASLPQDKNVTTIPLDFLPIYFFKVATFITQATPGWRGQFQIVLMNCKMRNLRSDHLNLLKVKKVYIITKLSINQDACFMRNAPLVPKGVQEALF